MNRQDARSAKEPGSEIDAVASVVIQAALEVHKILGPGFLEAVYEKALGFELALRGVAFVRQPVIPIVYKGRVVREAHPDLLVAGHLVVELKTVDQSRPFTSAKHCHISKPRG